MDNMEMNRNLISYYKDRAIEYDKVYLNPDEQEDLTSAKTIFQKKFLKKHILEIACGTGYWTDPISYSAASILATDINKEVIDIAKKRELNKNVTFKVVDLFKLTSEKQFEAVFGGFIWSHILLQDIDQFLNKLTELVIPNGDLVFIDSKIVEKTNHDRKEIAKTDKYGNTYQKRKLEDGTTHEILKNFPTRKFLDQKLSRIATDINFYSLKYYWIVSCKLTNRFDQTTQH